MSELLAKKDLFCEPESKSRNRFICEFTDSSGIWLPKFVVMSIDRPKCKRKNVDAGFKYNWLPINIWAYDHTVPSSAQAVWDHLVRNEKFNIKINVLGPVGDKVEEWAIVNANIIYVDFGNLDWRSANLLEKNEIHQPNVVRYYKGSDPILIHMQAEYEYAQLIF